MDLFVAPPQISPAEFLPAVEAQKVAGIRLTQPPSYWDDEITQILMRDHPYIPSDRVVVTFKKRDDAQGAALGFIGIIGAPTVSIPLIIKNRELSPLDVLIVRADSDGALEQGSGDMEDDTVVPLTEETFSQAMDTSDVGQAMPEQEVLGTGWTEDGSSLRLPFRGRTVVASVIGVSAEKKAKLASLIENDKQLGAGFVHNRTGAVIDSWLSAEPPKNLFLQKVASLPVERGVALVADALPEEIETSKFAAARVFVTGEQAKVAATFEAVDLTNPHRGKSRFLVFDDGTYCLAPEKVATFKGGETEDQMVARVFEKCATASLKRGSIVSFCVDGHLTVPAKIGSIAANEAEKSVTLSLIDNMAREYPVVLSAALKTAMFDPESRSWVLPMTAKVLQFSGYAIEQPMAIDKVARAFEAQLPDQLVCSGGQFSLSIRGNPFGGAPMGEAKMAALLNQWLDNGDALLGMVKKSAAESVSGTGYVRFQSNLPERVMEVTKLSSKFEQFPQVARNMVDAVGIPLEKAVKLAAAIGDPDGVDAVLSAGFLNEDNVAEFISLSDFFEETISKLARLLLAIRMGFPGDESATVVAMKSLQRVSEALRSATQEVAA